MNLDVNKSLIENSDYLKQLALEVEKRDVSDFDSNLTYEVAYAVTYLDILISKSSCEVLTQDLWYVKNTLDNVLSKIPYDEVSMTRKKLDYKKLMKCKYDDLDATSYEGYKVFEERESILEYIKSQIPSVLILMLLPLGTHFLCDYCSTFLDSADKLVRVQNTLLSIVLVVMYFIFSVLLMAKFTSMFITILYLGFPFIRPLLEDGMLKNLYQNELGTEVCLGKKVKYKKTRGYDREERNIAWLDSMLSTLEFMDSRTILLDDIYLELKNVSDEIKSSKSKGRVYFLLLSKVEFLRDMYLKEVHSL